MKKLMALALAALTLAACNDGNPDDVTVDTNTDTTTTTTTTTNLYYYYDWAYWGWYYPGWYPGWGWYYPGYYPPYVSSFRTGSVFIQMIDAKANATDVIPVVWSCILNGLAEGSTNDLNLRIQTGINQGFAQSPYLKH